MAKKRVWLLLRGLVREQRHWNSPIETLKTAGHDIPLDDSQRVYQGNSD